jgi:hypothetical protein
MAEHTRVSFGAENVDRETAVTPGPTRLADEAGPVLERTPAKIECNACPVLCQISEGRTGACDRYANAAGALVRVDPIVILERRLPGGAATALVPFAAGGDSWADTPLGADSLFVTGVGASSTYPDYKPAPFIVSAPVHGVDMVTVVTEGIFSYCSLRVKIDTDRYLGPEQANVRSSNEVVGHVTTAEYGSQMLSLGGVHHLTGGSKREGRIACELIQALGNGQAAELSIDGGSSITIQAGSAPVVDSVPEVRMRVGCGSATIGMFAQQWFGHVDEVIVVDDHITGVLSEHQAGRHLGMRRSGIRVRGRKSTPGRYFQVAQPGVGWGGTDIEDPLSIIESIDPALAFAGLRLLLVSTTGEHAAWFELDAALRPQPAVIPEPVRRVVERIGENCEPALCTVLFVGGAGGSLRSGATQNPVRLTRAIKSGRVVVTCGGAPTYIWPGGGITFMVDVLRLPRLSFGSVPTPAIVAPIEFTMALADYAALGGHMEHVRRIEDVLASGSYHADGAPRQLRRQAPLAGNQWPVGSSPMLG